MEYIIIKILLINEYYIKYFNYIDLDFYKNNNREVFRVLTVLKSLQEKEGKDYSVKDLAVFFYTQYPYLKPDDRALFDALFERTEETQYEENLVEEYLEKQRYQVEASKIAILALDVSQGRKDWMEVVEHVKAVGELQPIQEEASFVTDDLEELYHETRATNGFRWRLKTLNKILGSLRRGDFGFVFARPETGKTTFLASEITFMASQIPEGAGPILWFSNEEQGSKVQLRCYQATLGLTHEELFSDIKKHSALYYELTKGSIKIYDDAGISKKTVEKICQQVNPSLIIFDQIDKIYGFEAERHDLKMKTIYQWARELAKQYGPVIGVCQAGGTAEGKKYLVMTDVDSSHTAKQGEADFILGIGATNNEGEEYVRYLHACKNKLGGDEDSIPELRHGKVSVIIKPEIARYEDSMVWN